MLLLRVTSWEDGCAIDLTQFGHTEKTSGILTHSHSEFLKRVSSAPFILLKIT